MHKNSKSLLETIADVIVEAQKSRVYGLYNYSSYPGDQPPHLVRHELTGRTIKTFHAPEPARELYDRLCREHVAKEVLCAFNDWMQNDLYANMVKAGLWP